jgi:CRP-like cAMP-binding protein
LIRKHTISEASYRMLFDYLASVFEMPYMDFQPHLRQKLVGYDCKAPEHLIRELDAVKKCWFIVKGMVLVYYSDLKKGTVVYQLIEAGEIAILHDEFVNGKLAESGMIVVAGSELLEITSRQMDEIHELFPKSMKLQNKIISGLSGKVRQREELLRMEARDKVRAFHKLYPQVKGKKRKVRLLDKDAASYLDMTEFTFSRLAKEMEEG